MTTDNYGFETRWELKKSSGGTVLSGPPKNSNYYDNKRYIGGICLAPDQYKFTIYDKFQDGMCKQSTGKGNYKIYLDNVQKGSSPSCGTVWGKRQHSFTVKASNNNNNNNNNSNLDEGSSRGNGCSTVKVEFKVDQYGYETKVFLRNSSGDDKLKSVNEVGPKQTKTMSACLNAGTYKFIIVDNDGIGDGYYMVLVDGKQVVKGSSFTGQIDHKIKVGYDVQSLMSTRDKEWLNAHNTKRKTFHQRAGKNYRPLRWSTELAKDALSWATQLSKTCHSTTGILHEKFIDEGENLAKNKGSGSWGNQPDATNVLKRWVDNEEGMNYPANAHLTQVIWYATEYVGCGEKSVTKNGSTCSIQACRYARAGNCNVKNGNWKQVAYLDQTACGPLCPSDGCYK